jgi:cytochrome c
MPHTPPMFRNSPSFWQDCTFTHTVSKKLEPQQVYCERLEETAVLGGAYKN